MERICSWCKKYMGERCQRCGSERVKTLLDAQAADRLANDLGLPAPHRAFMRCEDCGNCWQQGSDGKTHGICQDCVDHEALSTAYLHGMKQVFKEVN